MFLSFPHDTNEYREVAQILRDRGLGVVTNFDSPSYGDPQIRSDLRLKRIRRCRAYVHFADEAGCTSPIREMEFGYALGREKAVAYVGKPVNSLHRYGDVFDDVEHFLDEHTAEYCERVSQWYSVGKGQAAVA